jgi:hypothetical protein
MKKIIIIMTILVGLTGIARADVDSSGQMQIKSVLNGLNIKSVWAQNISLWVENPGWSKYEAEYVGNQICSSTGHLGSYTITFWHSINGPRGKVAKVHCY